MSNRTSFNKNGRENTNNFKSKALEQNFFTGDEILHTEVNICLF